MARLDRATYRVSLHREGVGSGFTAKYGVKRLVYYEHHIDIRSAIAREKKFNPNWIDLYPSIVGPVHD